MGYKTDEEWYTESMTRVISDMVYTHKLLGETISFREALHEVCRANEIMGVYDRYMTGELDLDTYMVDVFNDGSLEPFDPNRQEDNDD